jgi:16S rRNA (uracil1498-N3)-methyltransferase
MFFAPTLAATTAGATVLLDGDEGKHAANVRRMRVGEDIQLTNGLGLRVIGKVAGVSPGVVEIAVEQVSDESQAELQITLVQALAKNDRDEMAIQTATELGVNRVIPWQSSRSIVRWDAAKAPKAVARWQSIVDEAAKQSMRSHRVSIDLPMTTPQLAVLIAEGQFDQVLVLAPTGSQVFDPNAVLSSGRLCLVVGPEGGIDDTELAALCAKGAKLQTLGANILRTSTAGPAVIAAIRFAKLAGQSHAQLGASAPGQN